jgi:hypothetical protein
MVLNYIRNRFRKKVLTDDEKVVNAIAHFIVSSFKIDIRDSSITEDEYGIYRIANGGPILFFYYNHYKILQYNEELTKELYKYIPDERLKIIDNELIRKVFKKLFYKEVDTMSTFRDINKTKL